MIGARAKHIVGPEISPDLGGPDDRGRRQPESTRPAGRARSRFSNRFYQDLADDWQQHGADVLARVRMTNPDTYLRVVAAILPKELALTMTQNI